MLAHQGGGRGWVSGGSQVLEAKEEWKVDKTKLGKVAVLMGGQSAEREISLKSGKAVLAALMSEGVQAEGIDLGPNGLNELQQGKFQRVFIALHGKGGEDGSLQGALEIMGIPYTGSGVLASALAMDKIRTKQQWFSIGLPTPSYVVLRGEKEILEVEKHVGFPCVVKPSREGSSIGVSKVHHHGELLAAYRQACQYDKAVIAESWVEGREFTVGILNDEPLPVIRIETPRVFYDFTAKYVADETKFFCPCGLPEEEEKGIQAIAFSAFQSLGCESWGRVDLIRDGSGACSLLEVNTVPGLTDHSLVPMAAERTGIGFRELVLRILAEASLKKGKSG
ncbi:MAG: D-alanine--D-alanine ligase [Gammaproteobacteria bacterium]|nr:D-alanine--D-alanine ligase [Gammaproteobacteria bacterium]